MVSETELDGFPDGQLSARTTIGASLRFAVLNIGPIVASIWLPSIVALVVLQVTLSGYFAWLAVYLRYQDIRAGSFALSLATLGIIINALAAVAISIRVAHLVKDGRPPRWFGSGVVRASARLFAAVLRGLFAILIAIFATAALEQLADAFVPRELVQSLRVALWAIAAGGIAIFAARALFLLPAIATRGRNTSLRHSWAMSRGHAGSLFVIWIALALLPVVACELIGEIAVRLVDRIPPEPSLADAATALMNQSALAIMTLSLTSAAIFSTVLATIGSCLAYEKISENPLSER